MPPKAKYPTPALRFHNGAWKILWSWDGKQYSVSTGLPEGDRLFAEQRRIEFAIALKKDAPAFPSEYKWSKSVIKYANARYGTDFLEQQGNIDPGNWIEEYEREITAECSLSWAKGSISRLCRLNVFANGFPAITPKIALRGGGGYAVKFYA